MKNARNIFFLIAWLFGTLIACTVHVVEYEEPGEPVTITVESGESRAPAGTHAGDDIDSRIESIRVLGYKVSNYALAFNELVAITGLPADAPLQGTVDVLTGTYHFVFIANENSDSQLAAKLANPEEVSTLPKLRELSFGATAFDSQKPIPMVTLIEHVKVIGDNTLQIPPDQNIEGGVWQVQMERLAVRIDLSLEMSDAFAAGAALSFTNVPDKVFLFQKENTGITGSRSITAVPSSTTTNGLTTLTWKRIILPESWFSPISSDAKGVVVSLANGSDSKQAKLGVAPDINPGTDYTMPRNYYFDITGYVQESKLDFELNVMNWKQALDEDYFGGSPVYKLTLNKTSIGVYDNLEITTNHPDGWTARVSSSATSYIPSSDILLSTYSGGPGTEILFAEPNINTNIRCFIHITAGNLTVIVSVSTIGGV